MKKWKKVSIIIIVMIALVTLFASPVLATGTTGAGNVSSAIESTWKGAATKIKTVTNNVVFPVVDCILAILLFVKLATSYFDYKKHGQFEFTGAAIIFFGLIFALTAPLYIWSIIGI